MTLTSDVKQRQQRSQHNRLNPNNVATKQRKSSQVLNRGKPIIRKPKREIYLDITNYNVNMRQKINAEQINSQQIL